MAANRKRSFWDMFTLTENGRIKNTFLLYAFALSFVFLAAYGIAFALLIDPMQRLFAAVSPLLAGVMECLVPAAAGTAVCLLCQKVARNKALAPVAFVFLAVELIAFAILLLAALPPEDYGMAFTLLLQAGVPPLVMGGGCTGYVWRRHAKHTRMPGKETPERGQDFRSGKEGNGYGGQ